ncbi:MAG: hypothetical protein RIR18_1380 [Pseudomonadota bacterium]
MAIQRNRRLSNQQGVLLSHKGLNTFNCCLVSLMLDYKRTGFSTQGCILITALHSKRNRPYLHALVYVLLVSWISLVISATCVMPMPSVLSVTPDHMPGCPDADMAGNIGHQDHTPQTLEDCTLTPCLDSQPHSLPDFNRLAKPDLPVLILGLFWTFCCLFLSYPPPQVLRKKTDSLPGRQVSLIYRFCTLLN